MKKITIVLLALIAIVSVTGCTKVVNPVETTEPTQEVQEPTDEPVQITPEPEVEEQPMPDSVIVTGIVSEINDDMMITLTDVEGLNGESSVVVLISPETQWDISKDFLDVGKFMQVELSMMMTRSLPPQSNALKVFALNDIILGEVLEIDETSMMVKPISDFYSNEEVMIRFSEDIVWNVEQSSISAGHIIRVVVANEMTASIPPQVGAIAVLSIETQD